MRFRIIMKITSFEISGYWRLFLRGITYIKYVPSNNVLVVLGTNGSGKSSFIEEYSINPAEPAFFEPGGYKIVKATHRGSEYVFTSHIEPKGNVFSIMKDGIELNKGYTVTVYKEILKKEFKMTKQVHELLIGKRRLHEMSAEERKNWIIALCGVDYTYALNYFAKTKEAHRDVLGAIRTIHTRLSAESAKVVDDASMSRLENEYSTLQSLLYMLLESKGNKLPVKVNPQEVVTDVNLLKSLSIPIRSLQNTKKSNSSYISLPEYVIKERSSNGLISADILRQTEEQEIAKADATIELLYKEYTSLSESLSKLKLLHAENKEELIALSAKLSEEQESLKQSVALQELFVLIESSAQARDAVNTFPRSSDGLKHVLTLLVENSNDKFTPAKFREAGTKLEVISIKLSKINQEINTLAMKQAELEHLKQHARNQCPACSHVWYKGYNEVEYRNILRQVTQTVEDKQLLTKELEAVQEYAKECEDYLTNYRLYLQLRNTCHTSLQIVLEKNSLVKNNPSHAYKLLELYGRDIDIVNKYFQVHDRSLDVENLLREKESTGNISAKEISVSIESLSETLYETQKRRDEGFKRLNHYKYYVATQEAIELHRKTVKAVVSRHNERKNKEQQRLENNYFLEAINTVNLRMSQIERDKSQTEYQKKLVKDLEAQLVELTLTEKAYSEILDSLSPKTGLIAKGLGGFINYFVGKMNATISKYWSYPLEILPVDIEQSVGLDFKFEVLVNSQRTIPDVREGSGAIREILNLAFKLEAAEMLDLGDHAVYLDEFGVKMDAAHREIAYSGLMKFIDESNFSQLVVISHYEQGYGSLSNADFIILCDKNVVVPDFARNHPCVSFKK